MASGTTGKGFESSRNAWSCCDWSDELVALSSASPGKALNSVGEKLPTGPSANSMLSPVEVELPSESGIKPP